MQAGIGAPQLPEGRVQNQFQDAFEGSQPLSFVRVLGCLGLRFEFEPAGEQPLIELMEETSVKPLGQTEVSDQAGVLRSDVNRDEVPLFRCVVNTRGVFRVQPARAHGQPKRADPERRPWDLD